MSQIFKTCMFGGFDKQDVVTYIEAQSRKHAEELETQAKQHDDELGALRRNLISLQEELNDVTAECNTLHERADRAASAEHALAQANEELAALRVRCQTLQEENDRCKGPAAEYEKLRDRIADIEINAHRRTEEFRANALEQLRDIAAQQRAWCDREKQKYAIAQQELMQKLAQSKQLLESGADGMFDEMLAGLDAFEDNLV